VDSLNDADGLFADGYFAYGYFAYAYLSGHQFIHPSIAGL
jgi:hypothetical protein